MRPSPTAAAPASADLAGQVEVRLDATAAPGDVVPALARLLRAMRDRRPPAPARVGRWQHNRHKRVIK
jgi:hypothetical protein